MSRQTSADSLLARFFRKVDAPKLGEEDFPHLVRELSLLPTFMRNAIDRKEVGINVLIYGEPGTGKTEFCRLLGKMLETPLYEVKCGSEDGDPICADYRFSAYQLSQCMLARKTSAWCCSMNVKMCLPEPRIWTGSEKQGMCGESQKTSKAGSIGFLKTTPCLPSGSPTTLHAWTQPTYAALLLPWSFLGLCERFGVRLRRCISTTSPVTPHGLTG
ncbi:MAG: ATP-binding protein [Betaproteobacteria bacterium]|nr:ATP-binding protein [Betaproteobacteria bacterium]